MVDFVYDPDRDLLQNIPWNLSKVSRPPVDGGHGTDGNRVVVGPTVTHYPDRTNPWQNGEVLPDLLVKAGLLDLIPQDSVGFTNDLQLFRSDFADHPNPQARAWEWLPPNQFVRNTQHFTQFTGFILEELTQWFDQLETKLLW